MSVYLDAIRLAAACVVVASHFGWSGWTGGFGWRFTPFGMVAVVVFFVLSGYVIAFSVEEEARVRTLYAAMSGVFLSGSEVDDVRSDPTGA